VKTFRRAVRLSIFVGEGDIWHHKPLYSEIVHRAHQAGLAGATVIRGIEGYGATSHIHTTHLLQLSEDLPLLIIIIGEDSVGSVSSCGTSTNCASAASSCSTRSKSSATPSPKTSQGTDGQRRSHSGLCWIDTRAVCLAACEPESRGRQQSLLGPDRRGRAQVGGLCGQRDRTN
jgi:PII-like signaling protein